MTLSWQQVLSYKYQYQRFKYKYQYPKIVLKYRSSTSTQYNKTAAWWKFHNASFHHFSMIHPSDRQTYGQTGDSKLRAKHICCRVLMMIIVEQTSVYHTVNGSCALFHTSKTAQMITVILLRAPCQNVNVLLLIWMSWINCGVICKLNLWVCLYCSMMAWYCQASEYWNIRHGNGQLLYICQIVEPSMILAFVDSMLTLVAEIN